MAGTSTAVGLIGAVATVSFGLVLVGGAISVKQALAGAADASALAAADVASGAVATTESACAVAARVAAANGAILTGCEISGVVATVEASVTYLGFASSARARAGPPG